MIFKNNYLNLNSYQKKYLSKIKELELSEPFFPWKNRTAVNMEGMFACGWTNDNLILMVCYDGYIITNPLGEIIEENKDISPYELMSKDNLEFKVQNRNENIKIFGLYGGNGNLVSSEGWKLEIIYPSWPNSFVVLKRPRKKNETLSVWEGIKLLALKEQEYTNLKCGFSINEKHFLISGSNGVEIFSKE